MFRRPLFALALLSALTSCVAAPPSGPLVEYRAGLTPITRPVKCPGTYALYAHGQPLATGPLREWSVLVGQRLGFHREADGSLVAVAPAEILALPPGEYSWELVPGSAGTWREQLREHVRERSAKAAEATRVALCAAGFIAIIVLLLVWAYLGSDQYPQGRKR